MCNNNMFLSNYEKRSADYSHLYTVLTKCMMHMGVLTYLPIGLATWDVPTGGMFLWMRFTDLEDSYQLVMNRLVERKVLFVAGKACNVSENQPCPYARISFSLASTEEMERVSIEKKTNNLGSEHVRHKPSCTSTEYEGLDGGPVIH